MTDQGAEGLLSPYLRRKRIEAVAPWLNGRVLDFGCGTGLLAELLCTEKYVGVERDKISLQLAKSKFPQHYFISTLPSTVEKFDTVVALAVIEHVREPVRLLFMLAAFLGGSGSSRLVITTPHPSVDWIHRLGATFGVFSSHARDEHEGLLGRVRLIDIGIQAGLKLKSYSRFLFGANQIVIYSKKTA